MDRVRSGAVRHDPSPTPGHQTDWYVVAIGAGLIAGVAMAMFAMLASVMTGDGLWAPLRFIAALLFGESSAGEAFDGGAVLTGAAMHLILSIVFAVIYVAVVGAFTNRLPRTGKVIAGLIYGIALWALNTFLIAPVLPGGELIELNVEVTTIPAWAWSSGHLVFGATLGALDALWRGRATHLLRQ